MINEEPTSGDKAERNKAESDPPTYLDLYKNETYPQTKNPRNNQHNARAERNPLKDAPKWTDVAIVILTGGIVFFAFMQWYEMSNAGVQTNRIIAADERLATAMESSVMEANKALTATQEAMRVDQRPWVNAQIALVPPPPVLPDLRVPPGGHIVSATVQFLNTGKTPAMNLQLVDVIHQLPSCPSGNKPLDFPKDLGSVATATLSPGQTAVGEAVSNVSELSHAGDPRREMYIYGVLNYEDVFKVHHRTEFSAQIRERGWVWCPTHNTMD